MATTSSPCWGELSLELRGFPPDLVVSGWCSTIEAVVTTDGPPIQRVEFWLNSYLFRTETIPPYAMNGDRNGFFTPWNTTVYPNGYYWLRADAFDADGNTAWDIVTFTIFNNTPPTVSCSANVAFGNVPLAVQFTATVHDPDDQFIAYSWDFGDTTTSSEPSPRHIFTLPEVYTVQLTVSDGMAQATARMSIRAGVMPYLETNGLAVVEAEGYDLWFEGSNADAWEPSTWRALYSGDGFLQSEPDIGVRYTDNSGPRVEYWIDFLLTGDYYIWIRGYAVAGGATCRLSMNGITISDNAEWRTLNSWQWTSVSTTNSRLSTYVSEQGLNILSIGTADDGLAIDKIILTIDPDSTPVGLGPAAPARAPRLSPVRGDTDMNNKVNILDLIFIRNRLGASMNVSNNRWADANTDNKIDILDLIYCRNHLGQH